MVESNFSFLKNQWPQFFQRSEKAESFVITDPRTSLAYSRMALEMAVNWMFTNDQVLSLPYDTSLNSLMSDYEFKQQFTPNLYNDLHLIKKLGNLALHNKPVHQADADVAISNLYYFAKWFAKNYATEKIDLPGLFDGELIPREGADALSKKQFEELQNKFESDLDKFQTDLQNTLERNKILMAENDLFKRQIKELQAQIQKNKENAVHLEEIKNPRTEKETRKYLIDVSLREAGWDLSGARDKEYKVNYMPSSTNKSQTGYIDYVLWDDDGSPLAVVEAKKSLVSAKQGENQGQLYADALEHTFGRRPVIYYTNGFEIYLWDDQFYKSARQVHGYYTQQELQTLMFRRKNRKDIRIQPIDNEIAGRTYQMRAIKSIAEHFAGNDKNTKALIGTNRGALLVLATGTGKTRTAIAFSKLLLESNWAKRILFLADRKSLVRQAKRNFVKLLPEHKCVNLLEEKDNPEARFAFSTYPTMMGLIDGSRNKEQRFYGVGHFDLIIIDEAHRSIYKKYQSIFEYFDALLLGLTATPKDSIDRNTYSVFGLADKHPTDAYTFDEAVKNNHLVPYRTIELSTKFLSQGIRYADLTPEEKERFEEEILDGGEATGEEWVNPEALNQWLFNKDTAIETLLKIVELGIKNRSAEELGKTIIFAKNKAHADFLKEVFLELDRERYGNDYVKVITHGEPKAEEFIERFCDEEKNRLPQIVISVDMMDTGIDAPSCVNLVFYKPVKSYAKFWQMIGRGSRLRPNLFGPEKHKTHFIIFDLCDNFTFFEENPNGIESNTQKSLVEIVFGLRLKLAIFLDNDLWQKDEYLASYRRKLLDDLFEEIASLDKTRFDVRMKMKSVLAFGSDRNIWNYLEPQDIRVITNDLAPLVKPPNGESDLVRQYDKLLYLLILKKLEIDDPQGFVEISEGLIRKVIKLSKKLLKKSTIPEINARVQIINSTLQEDFWLKQGISHLEHIRSELRNLMKYIDFEDQIHVMVDYKDHIFEPEASGMVSLEPNVNNVLTFQSNQHRLEQIIRENKHNVTIQRIFNAQTITQDELNELENLLFGSSTLKEQLEEELGKPIDLVSFIKSLVGLSSETVDNAFASFINEFQLNSIQIQFLDTLKQFLTTNGKIDLEKLYESPFKSFHSLGINGVFDEQQTDSIFEIVKTLNDPMPSKKIN